MIPARLSIFNAIFAVLLVAVGVAGAHLGAIPPMTGFLAFLLSFVIANLALLFGLIGLAHTWARERQPGRPKGKAVAGIVLGLLIAVPVGFTIWRWLSMPYPNINDITTDYDNP